MIRHPHDRSHGFTLIEMLVALVIVATALAAISSSYASLVGNADTLRERQLGRWIAENRLVQTHLENPWPQTGTSEGQLKYAGYDWTWKQTVQPSPDPDFRRVEVIVSRKDHKHVAASLVSFQRNPTPGKFKTS